jgi:hypothetical protein
MMTPPRPPYRRTLALIAVGLLLIGVLVLAITSFAAPGPLIPTGSPLAVQPDPNAPSPATTPQPVAVQALDATRFVVVTREPRLVTRVGGDGRYLNMILHVVTHYTVQDGRLKPIEHVHVPEGWRPLTVGE